MASGYASVEAMDRMIRTLTKFMGLQKQLIDSLKRDYELVGTEWNDEKYRQMESAIGDVVTAMADSYVALNNSQIQIQVYKRALLDYLHS